jgi:predicted phosphodiesterase
MASPLRIAVVADIHHGKDNFTKKASSALPLMSEFVRFVSDTKPDAVIDLGDRISDESHAADLVLEREVAQAFAPISQPRFHVCGNHDREYLTVAENEAIFSQPMGHRTVDIGDWRLVIWAADTLIRRPGGFVLTEADLLWLAGVVATADRPLAIMSHVPISGHGQTGNYYFERNPDSSTYPGAERARAVLRQAKVPVVCVSGHVHWNTLTTIDGIPHITLQSLTESFTTYPEPAGSWGLLELGESINWTVFGRDRFSVQLDAKATARRWITPLQPFHEHPEKRLQQLTMAAE